MRSIVTALLLVGAAILFTAPAAVAQIKTNNVLLLSIDTLRADALHSYGYPKAITPTIDGLANEGVLFEDVLTTIGKTGPAFSSLFTSLSPPSHGARRNGVALRPDVATLAETFSANGYQAAAFISNWTLRSRLAKVDRGFDLYNEKFDSKRNPFGAKERSAEAVIEAVDTFLEGRGESTDGSQKPLFLWVHFSEPHSPYELHESVRVDEPEESEKRQGWKDLWRYANEVAYTDQQVAVLLDKLGNHWNLEETLIVFVADHGESFGEHGYSGHGKNTHWPNLRIPLIIKGPEVPTNKRVKAPAMITDIFPTLQELLKLEPIDTQAELEGRSLVPAWKGDDFADRLRFTVGDRHTAFGSNARSTYEHPKEISLQSKDTKVIYDFSSKKTTYFDLLADPLENTPLDQPAREANPQWRRQLSNWYRGLPHYEAKSGEISEEDRKQLESMGYVGAP